MESIVSFDNRGLNIKGIVCKADSPGKPPVLMPTPGLKYRVGPHRLYVSIARFLQKNGYTSFRFDFPGIGDSEGSFSTDIVLDLWYQIQHGYFVQNCLAAIQFFQETEKQADLTCLGLCGGAITSLLTAVEQPAIKSLVLLGLPIEIVGAPSINVQSQKSSNPGLVNRILDRNEWQKFISVVNEPQILTESVSAILKKDESLNQTGIPVDANEHYFNLVRSSLENVLQSGRRVSFIYGEADVYYKQFKQLLLPWLEEKAFYNKINLKVIKHCNHSLSLPDNQQDLFQELTNFLSVPWVTCEN